MYIIFINEYLQQFREFVATVSSIALKDYSAHAKTVKKWESVVGMKDALEDVQLKPRLYSSKLVAEKPVSKLAAEKPTESPAKKTRGKKKKEEVPNTEKALIPLPQAPLNYNYYGQQFFSPSYIYSPTYLQQHLNTQQTYGYKAHYYP